MIWHQREPTLKEILSDSIVTALMSADGVDPLELEAMLTQIKQEVEVAEPDKTMGYLVMSPSTNSRCTRSMSAAQQRPEPPSRTDMLQGRRGYTVPTL
jgi:hypothetical protein